MNVVLGDESPSVGINQSGLKEINLDSLGALMLKAEKAPAKSWPHTKRLTIGKYDAGKDKGGRRMR